ncbi:MAG: SprT-like domain-containing protein [Bacteroidia bacterium]|nr:SprT-like domain-containing protein [Bacteroidia bacterium]MCZ2278287.1 SprT-like domain-containing protein [Bacteroidia bacterium]
MNLEQVRTGLSKYVPLAALAECVEWIRYYRFDLRITKSRSSKFGDYRPPKNGKGHIITINHDLNPYAFLITYAHEVAHLAAFQKSKTLKDPHGSLWKAEFRKVISPLLNTRIFPSELLPHVINYIRNPAATSCTDINMLRALKRYDNDGENWLYLEEIETESLFKIRTGREFIKKQLVRKNFLCVDPKTKHKYTLNPLMEVQVIKKTY